MKNNIDNTQKNNHVVYKHTSPSGKSYIGYTNNPDRREKEHSDANGDNPAFHAAIKKYGWDSMKTTILEKNLTLEEAKDREKYYIKMFDTYKNGYNLTKGGDGNPAPFGKDNHKAVAVRVLNMETMRESIFDTIADAAQHLGIHGTQISIIMKNVESKDFSGCWRAKKIYTFQRYDPEDPYKEFDLSMMKTKEETIDHRRSSLASTFKPVVGSHILGFSVQFDSIKEASRVLEVSYSRISHNALGYGGPVKGFTWVFEDETERAKYPTWTSKGRCGAPGTSIVREKSDGTKDIFVSINDAIRKTKMSRKIINKRLMNGHVDSEGSHWKYL